MTFNDVLDVMLDVTALVTRGSELASTEARRVAVEREHRADDQVRHAAMHETARLRALQVAISKVAAW